MTVYKDLCSNCDRVDTCHFWLDLLKQENIKIINHYQNARVSTITIAYACQDYKSTGKEW